MAEEMVHGVGKVSARGKDWVPAAAHALATYGFCVLSMPHDGDPLINPDLCTQCALAAERRLARLLSEVRKKDYGIDETWRYEEICHRHENSRRYDMSIAETDRHDPKLADAASWATLHREADRIAKPVIDAAVARLGACAAAAHAGAHRCMAGCVVAAPGALDQPYHCDGDEQLYNCFVPLVPVSSCNGPTQFLVGSHVEHPCEHATLHKGPAQRLLAAPELQLGGRRLPLT